MGTSLWKENSLSYQVSLFYLNGGYRFSENAVWLDASHWRGNTESNSFVSRDEYRVTISEAQGTDGLAIAPSAGFIFVVDYPARLIYVTPPPPPMVFVCGDGSGFAVRPLVDTGSRICDNEIPIRVSGLT